MSSRDVSRRGVLKTGATLASVGALGSLSGCSGLLGGDGEPTENGDGGNASGSAADIPARSNLILSLSIDGLLNDQAIRGAVNDALEEQAPENSMLPSSVSEALDKIEEETGADPRKLNEIVLFGESQNDEETEYVGWLAYTDWSQSKLQSLFEKYAGSDIQTEQYEGTTIYVNDGADGTTEEVAVLSDGTVVLGRDGAARDVIDVRNGNADPISGELLTAWKAASGEYATFAMDIEPEDLPDGQAEAAAPTVKKIKYAYGSVYADGDKRGVELNMETGSSEDASDVATFFEGQIELAKEKAEDPQAKEMLENTDVSTSGTTVTITNEVDVSTITPVIKSFVTLFISGMGSSEGFDTEGTALSL